MTTLELQGIGHELKFWKEFVKTKRFLDHWVSDKVITAELAQEQAGVVTFIKNTLHPDCKVLDLGSGVVSILNGLVPKHQLTASDPLGELYECIFDYKKYNIVPPVAFPAEELPQEWTGMFDIVHMRNALDHSQDPFKVLESIFRVRKPGGKIIIHGFTNEAIHEDWKGFHQWNIELDPDGHLLIQNKDKRTAITDTNFSETKILSTGKEWFTWIA